VGSHLPLACAAGGACSRRPAGNWGPALKQRCSTTLGATARHQDLDKNDTDVDSLSLAYADEDRQYNPDGSVAKMSLQITVGAVFFWRLELGVLL
jgi:hypothetical protein